MQHKLKFTPNLNSQLSKKNHRILYNSVILPILQKASQCIFFFKSSYINLVSSTKKMEKITSAASIAMWLL